MIDRNLQVSYLIVDEMHHDHPELIKDQYWDDIFPNELPYTIATERFREEHPEPSTAKIDVSKSGAMPTTMSSVRIDEMVGKEAQNAPLQTVNYKFPENVNEEEVRIKTSNDLLEIRFNCKMNWLINIYFYFHMKLYLYGLNYILINHHKDE